MIRFSSSGFMEVRCEVDICDATAVAGKALSLVAGGDPVQVTCLYDKAIFRGDSCLTSGVAEFRCSEDEAILRHDGGLVLAMDADSWELLAALLERAERGERYAPEISELPVQGKKRDVTLVLATDGQGRGQKRG